MKIAALAACLAAALAVTLPGQQLDLPGMRSEQQFRGGVQAYHRGFYGDSIVSLEKALSFKPSNALAQAWLGRALWKSGFEQEAVRSWERLENAGLGGGVIRDWIQTVKLRTGTARETPRIPRLAVSAELDGNLRGEYPLRRPTSVRPRADGSFYVAAFGSNEIVLMDANFRVRESLRGGLGGWDKPYDVLETADGTLFVSEYGGNRITKCNARGERLKSFGRTGRGE